MISRCSLAVKSDDKHPIFICKNTGKSCRFVPPSSRACQELYGGGDGLTDEQRAAIMGSDSNTNKTETKRRGRRKKYE